MTAAKLPRLYEVELVYEVIVVAEDPHHAEILAERSAFRITSDYEPRVMALHEIKEEKQVHLMDWGLDCLPYGNHEDKTVEKWLEEIEARPVPDTKTLPLDLRPPDEAKG